MADLNKLLGQLLGSSAAGGFTGGLAGGLASSMLTTKKGRKLSKKALKLGGIAAVGALAYGAYQKYSGEKGAGAHDPAQPGADLTPAPMGSSFLPAKENTSAHNALGLTLVRAMIAAARSDGNLDAQESQVIFQKIDSLEIGQEEKTLLIEEMGHPVDMDAIINSANSQEVASEIYVASLLAIDMDTRAEESYLGMLAARLKLPKELVKELHHQVDLQTENIG